MKKQEIQNKLTESHASFITYLTSLTEEQYKFSNNQKWSAAEQLDHIYRSVKLLPLSLSFPKVILKVMFGKTKGVSLTYNELIKKYSNSLDNGAKASGLFIPKKPDASQIAKLAQSLSNSINKLNQKISDFSEEELDTVRLPHPILGKITVREMMYFSIYHVEHHLESIKINFEIAGK